VLRRAVRSAAFLISPLRRLVQDRARLAQEVERLTSELRSNSEKTLFPFSGAPADMVDRSEGPARFLVTSWGHSGSIWLVGALNLHEEMLCSVGVGHPVLGGMLHDLNQNLSAALEGDLPRLFEFGTSRIEAELLAQRGVAVAVDRDIARLPYYIFEELRRLPGADRCAAIGNVHGTTLTQLADAYRQDAAVLAEKPVAVMDLIRHPVPRTESAIKATMAQHLDALEEKISHFIAQNATECLALERAYRIDFSEPRARASLHVYRQGLQNDVWAQEIRAYAKVQRLLFERLQQDPGYFSWALHALSHGRVVANKDYLDRVFSAENLGAGRQSTRARARPPGPAEQYQQWSPWEQNEFARVARRLDMQKSYFACGYDFSFIRPIPQ